IKVLKATVTDEEEIKRFIDEANKLASLKHPHIVKVFNFSVQDGLPYLVMEYAPHGTLKQRYSNSTPLPLLTIVAYVKQVASALQYMHNRRLVHCDVKPANLLLRANDELILSDF